jgi:cobalamin biosynthesis protein CobT
METALNNLDSKLDKVEAAGIDTNTARTQYYKAVESLANLKLEITTTNELLKIKLNDSNIDVNSVNSILKNLNNTIHTAKQDIVKAVVEYNKLKNDFVKQNKKEKQQDKIQERIRDANTHDDENEVEDDSNSELEDQNSIDDSNDDELDSNDDNNSSNDDDSNSEDESEDSLEDESEDDSNN